MNFEKGIQQQFGVATLTDVQDSLTQGCFRKTSTSPLWQRREARYVMELI